MDQDILKQISALLAHARNLLDEMEVSEWDEDTKENWIYELGNVKSELDIVIKGMEQGKF